MRGVIINSHISEVFRKKIFCLQKAVKKACHRGGRQLNALLSKLETGPRYRLNIISISISYSFVSFFPGFTFLTGVYVEYSLQNRFVFFISLFGLSAILKIRNGEHAHHMGLVVAYTWIREKQMFVALGKEFDMRLLLWIDRRIMAHYLSHKILLENLVHRDIGKSCIRNLARRFFPFDTAKTNKETKIRKETCCNLKPGNVWTEVW